MASYRLFLYHIIFSPHKREPVLLKKNRNLLYKYIKGVIGQKKCHVHAINGIEDHIHLLVEIRPDIAVSDFIKDVKVASSIFIKKNKLFPKFSKWQVGYSAFTRPYESKERLITYINNQEEHHKRISFYDEYNVILRKNGFHDD
jgi:REP element-mobilizing transposase RayT